METYKQWKERLFRLAKTKGVRFDPWEEEKDSLVMQWNNNLTIEEVLLSHKAGKRCFQNERAIKAASKCGCFYCLNIFAPKDIKDWTDGPLLGGGERTALCPHCKVDAVLPDTAELPVDRELLKRLHQLRFSRIEPWSSHDNFQKRLASRIRWQ